jgi:hypothetical protein
MAALANAIRRRLAELKVASMGDLSDATPFFDFRLFVVVFTYHFLSFMVLGPMAGIVVMVFSGYYYARNTAFLPGGALMMYWMAQTMTWMMVVIPVGMVVYSKLKYDMVKFSLFPLSLTLGLTLFRIFIISIRHSTTPPRIYRDMYTQAITDDNLRENLMLRAWTIIDEKHLTEEVTRFLLSNEVFQDFFTFKVFLPIYLPLRNRLLKDNAYKGVKWDNTLMYK